MRILKLVTVIILSLLFGVVLQLLVLQVVFLQLFGQPQTLKQALDDGGVYTAFVDETAAQLSSQSDSLGGLTESEAETVIRNSLPEGRVQIEFEGAIDGIYDWLAGDTDQPQFELDFTQERTLLAQNIAAAIEEQLQQLEPCTTPAQIEIAQSIEELTCLPPGFSPAAEAAWYEEAALSSDGFLPNTRISSDELLADNDFFASSVAPVVYQRLGWLHIPLLVILVVLTPIILAMARSKRRGARRIANQLLNNGVVLGIASIVLWLWLRSDMVVTGETIGPLQEAVLTSVRLLFRSVWLVLGLFVGGSFIGGLLLRIATKKHKP